MNTELNCRRDCLAACCRRINIRLHTTEAEILTKHGARLRLLEDLPDGMGRHLYYMPGCPFLRFRSRGEQGVKGVIDCGVYTAPQKMQICEQVPVGGRVCLAMRNTSVGVKKRETEADRRFWERI